MLDALPKYYADSHIVANLTSREAAELFDYQERLRDVLDQFFVLSATWGLDIWEEICGLPIQEGKPDDQRRSVILSKMRGAGTVTVPVIHEVVDAFENGEVSVREDFENYEVVVTFIGKRGRPPNVDDVKDAVREILPAHLNVRFEYTYLRWEELDAAALTWDRLDAMNMTWDDLEVWKP